MTTGLTLFTISATTLISPGRKRMWVLSGLVTPLLAILGIRMAMNWLVAGAFEFTEDGIAIAELMKAYFIVDLAYSAYFYWKDTPFLECCVHHVFYIWYLDWLGNTGQTSVLQPFLIAEVPTAIRSLAELFGVRTPLLRQVFMLTFLIFRILWPAWVLTRVWMSAPNFMVGGAAITLHCYWFGLMLRRQFSPLQDVRYSAR